MRRGMKLIKSVGKQMKWRCDHCSCNHNCCREAAFIFLKLSRNFGPTVWPIICIKKQPIRNPVIHVWCSLANQQLSCKKNWHVLAERKIVLAQRKSHVLAASYINQNTVDQSQGFAVYMCRVARRIISLFIIAKYSKIPLLRFEFVILCSGIFRF